MSDTRFPLRMRLWRGRTVHAGQEYAIEGVGVLTACNTIGNRDGHHMLHGDAAITCPTCAARTTTPQEH